MGKIEKDRKIKRDKNREEIRREIIIKRDRKQERG